MQRGSAGAGEHWSSHRIQREFNTQGFKLKKVAYETWKWISLHLSALLFCFAFAVFIASIVAIVHWNEWIERHAATAAWVQAAGIFLALIVGSILAPLLQRKSDEKRTSIDRTKRSKSLAISLAGDMYPFASEVAILYRDLKKDIGQEPPDSPVEWEKWFIGARLNLPLVFQSAVPLTFDLDDDWVQPVRDLVSACSHYNGYLESFRTGFDEEISSEAWRKLQLTTQTNLTLVCHMLDKLNGLYGGKPIAELIPNGLWPAPPT